MLIHPSSAPSTTAPKATPKQRLRSRFPKVRKPIQKAFVRWYAEHATQFPAPLLLIKRTDCCMEFTFPDLTTVLTFSLLNDEIGVHVVWQQYWWDALVFFEAYPKRVNGGYECALSEEKQHFETKQALWANDVFEPFLNWVNDKLLPANWLGIYGESDCATWARLLDDSRGDSNQDGEKTAIVPVWINIPTPHAR